LISGRCAVENFEPEVWNMAGLAFCGRSFDERGFCDLPGREFCRCGLSERDDGGRFASRRESGWRFVCG
jgi:hypothetical protein